METIKQILFDLSQKREVGGNIQEVKSECAECGEVFSCIGIIRDAELHKPSLCMECSRAKIDLERACPECGQLRELVYDPRAARTFYQCADCIGDDEKNAAQLEIYAKRFEVAVPKYYRDFDIKKITQWRSDTGSKQALAKYAEVMRWGNDTSELPSMGILAKGPSDEGKTFFLYQKIKELIFQGRSVVCMECDTFSHEITRRFGGDKPGQGGEWLDALLIPDVLFLDDLGKSVFTERYTSELFGLIERRAARNKPIFCTTNEDAGSLGVKMRDAQTAEALLRRLNAFCHVITFTKTERRKRNA